MVMVAAVVESINAVAMEAVVAVDAGVFGVCGYGGGCGYQGMVSGGDGRGNPPHHINGIDIS